LGSKDRIPGCLFPRFGVYLCSVSTVQLYLSQNPRNSYTSVQYRRREVGRVQLLLSEILLLWDSTACTEQGLLIVEIRFSEDFAVGRRFDSGRAQKKRIFLYMYCTVSSAYSTVSFIRTCAGYVPSIRLCALAFHHIFCEAS
jgi:hypothetical protein